MPCLAPRRLKQLLCVCHRTSTVEKTAALNSLTFQIRHSCCEPVACWAHHHSSTDSNDRNRNKGSRGRARAAAAGERTDMLNLVMIPAAMWSVHPSDVPMVLQPKAALYHTFQIIHLLTRGAPAYVCYCVQSEHHAHPVCQAALLPLLLQVSSWPGPAAPACAAFVETHDRFPSFQESM